MIWKLGGTETKKSLKVRVTRWRTTRWAPSTTPATPPNGTITIHDNRTFLERAGPGRSLQDQREEATARLVDSLTDPKEVPTSFCCGSSRLLGDEWFVGWGCDGRLIGAYEVGGKRIFKLQLDVGFSYRALPGAAPTRSPLSDLRQRDEHDAWLSQARQAPASRIARPHIPARRRVPGRLRDGLPALGAEAGRDRRDRRSAGGSSSTGGRSPELARDLA